MEVLRVRGLDLALRTGVGPLVDAGDDTTDGGRAGCGDVISTADALVRGDGVRGDAVFVRAVRRRLDADDVCHWIAVLRFSFISIVRITILWIELVQQRIRAD